jgi:hypothetical protein
VAVTLATASRARAGGQFTFPNGSPPACLWTQYGIAGMHRAVDNAGNFNGFIFFDNNYNWVTYDYSAGGATNGGPGDNSDTPEFTLYAGDCASTLAGGHYKVTAGHKFWGNLKNPVGYCSGGGCYPCASASAVLLTSRVMSYPLGLTTPINMIDALFGWYPNGYPLAPANC